MSDSSSSENETKVYSASRHIDEICDRYEAQLRSQSKPLIEDFLTFIGEADRDRLLRELVAIDYEFHQKTHPVDFAAYLNRFPASVEILRELHDELKSCTPDQEETVDENLRQPCSNPLTPQPLPPPSRFQTIKVAGNGGFATVWKAWDQVMERHVAVKIPHSLKFADINPSEVLREAQAASQLRHPNIVFVHEVDVLDGVAFIVTDYIDGMNLKDRQETSPVEIRQAASLVSTLAKAVQHAHDRGVIHRDLKLKNIIVDEDGEPHIADFGLAKRDGRPDVLAITGLVVGTPAYMAPEQARAEHSSVDRRTDIYSLGVILFELLTGRLPFLGNQEELLQQSREAAPPDPKSLKPDIPLALKLICLKCLNKQSPDRYQSASELSEDIDLVLADRIPLRVRLPLHDRISRWWRRNRTKGLTLLASMLTGVSLIATPWLLSLPAVDWQQVSFETVPKGCEITTILIDPATGEPDPTQIKTASGRTPLKTWLPPGDYLVVAVLNDDRFHEVLRHVPDSKEVTKLVSPDRYWSRSKSGIVSFRWPIRIPEIDAEKKMVLVEEVANWTTSMDSGNSKQAAKIWQIPAFYVERQDQVLSASMLTGTCAVNGNRYADAVAFAECSGKRLPSLLELQYVCEAYYNQNSQQNNTSPLVGLATIPWEWTTTRPFGAATQSHDPLVPLPESSRIALAGEIPIRGNGNVASKATFPKRLSTESAFLPDHGVRCVRSVRPRRNPNDFPQASTAKIKVR